MSDEANRLSFVISDKSDEANRLFFAFSDMSRKANELFLGENIVGELVN